jgi:Protein of unknown function DUF262
MKRRPTTQDITWFLDLNRNNQLDLEPPYQRKSVWTLKERKLFLDTIFRQYPCPPVFLHQTKDSDGKAQYHVVDGKQRLETVIKFANGDFPLGDNLTDLGVSGKRFSGLDAAQKRLFWDYIFTVEMLDIIEGIVLDEVFSRINTNARKLERQELRHAKYDGWFVNFVEQEAEKEEWKRLKVVTTARAKRMKDSQFISELFLVILDGQMVGFDQDYLDTKYAEYDNPQETHTDFSEEEFRERAEQVKSHILGMEAFNAAVSKYAKTFIHFYTLWALVVLNENDLPPAGEFAAKYIDFMNYVIRPGDEDEIVRRLESTGPYEPHASVYQAYATGASTDLTPRQMRYRALRAALLDINDENPSVSS